MDYYLVLETSVDENEDITTITKLFYNQMKAKIEYYTLIDKLKAKIAATYSSPYMEFDITEFGDIFTEDNVFVFKDFEGVYNFKIELIRLQEAN